MLPALAFIACLTVPVSAGQAQEWQFTRACALKENAVIIAIEEHGSAGDVSADQLGEAGRTLLRARSACYLGGQSEALALYDSILDLGPAASLHPRR